MEIDRDAAAVVFDRDLVIAQDDEVDFSTVAGERLVDRVVDYLVDQVMKPALGGVADIHPGALAHRLEALENSDRLRAVTVVLRLLVCHRRRFKPPRNHRNSCCRMLSHESRPQLHPAEFSPSADTCS